jgi:hypothetical protein
MKKIAIILFSTFFFLSCQPNLKKIYGIKDPEIESEKTILKAAKKYKLDSTNILTVNSKDFLYVLNGQSIPDAAIYDKNGKYIEYRQTDTSCNAGLFQFIPSLNLTDLYNQPDSSDLKSELKKYRDLKGNDLKILESADFYVIIYWAVWTGKLNKDHVKIWEDLAKENKNTKIKVLKVNLDLQSWWNKQERDEIIKILSKKK